MIGIFDSGVGGMTVARAIEQLLPACRQVYFGDLARSPYGSKSPGAIVDYSIRNMEFLVAKGASLVVVACNSSASVASDALRAKSGVPVFEVITPAVAQALRSTRNGRIGVIGTRATVDSGVYEKKIRELDPDVKVFPAACPLLVPLVEEGWIGRRETKMIIRRYLQPLKQKNIDTLVLGCTHYPLLKQLIQPRIGKRIRIVDSAGELANRLRDFLEKNPAIHASIARDGENFYYVSDVTRAAESISSRIFGRKIKLVKETW